MLTSREREADKPTENPSLSSVSEPWRREQAASRNSVPRGTTGPGPAASEREGGAVDTGEARGGSAVRREGRVLELAFSPGSHTPVGPSRPLTEHLTPRQRPPPPVPAAVPLGRGQGEPR